MSQNCVCVNPSTDFKSVYREMLELVKKFAPWSEEETRDDGMNSLLTKEAEVALAGALTV